MEEFGHFRKEEKMQRWCPWPREILFNWNDFSIPEKEKRVLIYNAERFPKIPKRPKDPIQVFRKRKNRKPLVSLYLYGNSFKDITRIMEENEWPEFKFTGLTR